MPVLTNVQIKSVAKFLKASCDKVSLDSPQPKLGQWLDILSREFGYKDWNVTSASNRDEPELVKAQGFTPISKHGFLGLARVIAPDVSPTNYLCYSEDRELSRFEIAAKLGQKMRSKLGPMTFSGNITHTRPDGMAEGQLDFIEKNRSQGCPVVISADGQGVTILLWWLSSTFLLNDPMPISWGEDQARSWVLFSDEGDHQLFEYVESQPNTTLTALFLETLTGCTLPSRTCWHTPSWRDFYESPSSLLVEEGNPNALQIIASNSGASWDELRVACEVKNQELGLSRLDCEAISARFEAAESLRNDDPVVDFSGVYDD